MEFVEKPGQDKTTGVPTRKFYVWPKSANYANPVVVRGTWGEWYSHIHLECQVHGSDLRFYTGLCTQRLLCLNGRYMFINKQDYGPNITDGWLKNKFMENHKPGNMSQFREAFRVDITDPNNAFYVSYYGIWTDLLSPFNALMTKHDWPRIALRAEEEMHPYD